MTIRAQSGVHLASDRRTTRHSLMTSNTQKRSKLKQLTSLCVAILLVFYSCGCVSLRNTSPAGSPKIANCSTLEQNSIDPAECCALYDRGEVVRQWVGKLHPRTLVPTPFSVWAHNCKERCGAVGTSIGGWIHAKKEEANAPPWPRFHPIPTKPVFEPEGAESSTSPEVYGWFGKG